MNYSVLHFFYFEFIALLILIPSTDFCSLTLFICPKKLITIKPNGPVGLLVLQVSMLQGPKWDTPSSHLLQMTVLTCLVHSSISDKMMSKNSLLNENF